MDGIISCKNCGMITKTADEYFKHMSVHRHLSSFQCAIPGCDIKFRNFNSFLRHGRFKHKEIKSRNLLCTVNDCGYQDTLINLMRHIRTHFNSHNQVPCLFGCNNKTFKNINSIRLHNRYYHKEQIKNDTQEETSVAENPQSDDEIHQNEEFLNNTTVEPNDPNYIEESIDLSSSTVFMVGKTLLRLLAQKHTQQAALQELALMFGEVATINEKMLLNKCNKFAADLNLNKEANTRLKAVIVSDNIFDRLFNQKNGILRSSFMRKKYFKKYFLYVPAIQVSLGVNKFHNEQFLHYVPILDTLRTFLEVESYYKATFETKRQSLEHFMTDFIDGIKYKQKKSECASQTIDILFYQDCAEVVNPLGNAKKRHKLLCCYMIIGNLEPHQRALTENVFLVLLCIEKDFIQFGSDRIFRHLIEDVKMLETDGIKIKNRDEPIKGTIFTTLGDNLGAHQLANITENFSTSQYFCLYCYCTLDEFYNNPLHKGQLRNPKDHKMDVDVAIDSNQHQRGVKGKCIFNELNYFNMFDNGAAPCIAHDLFEG